MCGNPLTATGDRIIVMPRWVPQGTGRLGEIDPIVDNRAVMFPGRTAFKLLVEGIVRCRNLHKSSLLARSWRLSSSA